MDKQRIVEFLSRERRTGAPFWGVGADATSAIRARHAGASWIVANHTAAFSLDIPATVLGLLPYADANGEVLAMAQAMPDDVPVMAGVFANDQFRTLGGFLRELRRAGYAAVQNFPTTGLADGKLKALLDQAGMGYFHEIELVRQASREDFFTSALVFSPEQAEAMAAAGADMLIFHPGLNADGEHREWNATAKNRFLDAAEAARNASPGILVARSGHREEPWPPRDDGTGIGVQFDGNFPFEEDGR